jgi:class 3 adenylate cyclase
MQGASGIDAILARNELRASRNRKVVLSVSDLEGFTRISAETLVHKSNAELWTLRKEADGKFYIERLFDDNGEPLKG